MFSRWNRHLSNGHSVKPSLSNTFLRCWYQFFGANLDPYSDRSSFRHPSLPNLFMNPLEVAMKSGLTRGAWGKAFTQSTDQVTHPKCMAKITKKQMVLHWTTGAYKSASSIMRSPLKQILALHLIISPAGFCLHLNTQVHGMICCPLALDLQHLIQTFFPSSCQISFNAAASHSLRLP